jgi:hypothetical protein
MRPSGGGVGGESADAGEDRGSAVPELPVLRCVCGGRAVLARRLSAWEPPCSSASWPGWRGNRFICSRVPAGVRVPAVSAVIACTVRHARAGPAARCASPGKAGQPVRKRARSRCRATEQESTSGARARAKGWWRGVSAEDLGHVWIGTWAGELVRADAVTGLRCAGGCTEAVCADGRIVRLAESGCPPDFHVQLLRVLARARSDSRWLLVISPDTTADSLCWTQDRVDDLVPRDPGELRPAPAVSGCRGQR